MKKRGISPLIATVLLLGFTVVLSVIVVTWVSQTVQEEQDKTDDLVQANNKCLDIVGAYSETFNYGPGTYNLKLLNNKGIDFEFRVLWMDSAGSIGNQSNSSVAKYSSVIVNSNAVSEGTYSKVKVIPFVNVGDGKFVDCGSTEISIELESVVTSLPGNGACEANENCSDSGGDCDGYQVDCLSGQICHLGSCVTFVPGNGYCEPYETCVNSAGDCEGKQANCPAGQICFMGGCGGECSVGQAGCFQGGCPVGTIFYSFNVECTGIAPDCCLIPPATCGLVGTCDTGEGESCLNCNGDCLGFQADCSAGGMCMDYDESGTPNTPSCLETCNAGAGRCFDVGGPPLCPHPNYPNHDPTGDWECSSGHNQCCMP